MTTSEKAIELAHNAIAETLRYAKNGLPPCYATFDEYLSDFYPNLPWDEGLIVALKHLLQNHRGAIFLIGRTFGLDFEAELQRSLERAIEDTKGGTEDANK